MSDSRQVEGEVPFGATSPARVLRNDRNYKQWSAGSKRDTAIGSCNEKPGNSGLFATAQISLTIMTIPMVSTWSGVVPVVILIRTAIIGVGAAEGSTGCKSTSCQAETDTGSPTMSAMPPASGLRGAGGRAEDGNR